MMLTGLGDTHVVLLYLLFHLTPFSTIPPCRSDCDGNLDLVFY